MNPDQVALWLVELNDIEHEVHSVAAISDILRKVEQMPSGRLWVGKDGGARPWWHRLLGTQSRYVDSLFVMEWCDAYASLIFHDENWSEYPAIDESAPVTPSEDVRQKISHGDAMPSAVEECMDKQRAILAAREYMAHNTRPSWLKYRYVR